MLLPKLHVPLPILLLLPIDTLLNVTASIVLSHRVAVQLLEHLLGARELPELLECILSLLVFTQGLHTLSKEDRLKVCLTKRKFLFVLHQLVLLLCSVTLH